MGLFRSLFSRRPSARPRPFATRPRLEPLEDRSLLTVSVGSNFGGMTFASTLVGTPPDTQAAVGPSHIVEAVNANLAVYNKAGTKLSSQALSSFFTSLRPRTLTDPVVSYDEQAGRFLVAILDIDTSSTATQPGRIDFAVSNGSDPTKGFTEMHAVNVTETAASGKLLWGDFLRFGRNADAYVFTVNMFTAPVAATSTLDHVQVVMVDKSSVTDANNATLTGNRVDRPGPASTLVPATMHDSASGGPMWFVQEDTTPTGVPTGGSLRVVRMDGVLSAAPVFTDYVLPVSPYAFNADTSTPPASQKGSTAKIATNDTRILSAAWRHFADGSERLVATQEVGTTDATSVARARWYEFSTASAAPTLTQSGQINPSITGTGSATYYPSVEINAAGDLGLTFMESSSNEYMSMYVTGQKAGDPAGVMQANVLVKGGVTYYSAAAAGDKSPFRAGDYSGISVDPSTGEFWAANEYAASRSGFFASLANWGTWFGKFTVSSAVTSTGNTALVVSGTPSDPVITTPTPRPLAAVVSQPGAPDDGTGPSVPSEHAFWAVRSVAAAKGKGPLWFTPSDEF